MAIYYHNEYTEKHGEQNFGDNINPWLLKKFIPKRVYNSQDECVVGIGTLLNDGLLKHISNFKRVHVFTSGVGYGSFKNLLLKSNINYIAVRGPISAKSLQLDANLAITDGAILISQLVAHSNKKFKTTFIPHLNTHWMSGMILKKACEKLGFNYLVPNADRVEFIDTVNCSELVITEAMHGAILADTLRVPWIPVKMHHALAFKWEDWCESLGLLYAPNELIQVYNPIHSIGATIRASVKQHFLISQLKKIRDGQFFLSSENTFEQRLGQLIDKTSMLS